MLYGKIIGKKIGYFSVKNVLYLPTSPMTSNQTPKLWDKIETPWWYEATILEIQHWIVRYEYNRPDSDWKFRESFVSQSLLRRNNKWYYEFSHNID